MVSSSAMAATGSIVTSISTAISRLTIRFFMGFSSCVFSRFNAALDTLHHFSSLIGAVKIYAQNCLQAPAE